MRRANGTGHITKLSGNRRRPYAVRKIVGWTEKGTPQYKYISYHKTQREAERALNKYTEDPYTLNAITLEALYNEWYEVMENEKADGTLRSYRNRFAHLKRLHKTKITDIDAITLENLYQELEISKGTLQDVNTLMNLLVRYAVKRRYLPINSANITKAINLPSKEEKHLNPRSAIDKTDISRLWSIADENEYAKVILVYIYTGLRYSELKNLEDSDIHENYLEIRQAKTPSGVRIVPICDKIKRFFPVKVPSHTTFDRYYKKLLPGHAIHDTRHTFTSLMTEAKIDIRIIKAIVGHKMPDITAIYTHISLEAMLEAVNQI